MFGYILEVAQQQPLFFSACMGTFLLLLFKLVISGFSSSSSEKSVFATHILNNAETVLEKNEVQGSISTYENLFEGARKGEITSDDSVNKRKDEYQTMVNNFYNLVTDFYEWGWGQSFHFAPRWKGETFLQSIRRAEYYLSSTLNLRPGMKVLDVGCGVGGPMRNISIFSGAEITGITINEYQVKVGNKYNQEAGLSNSCKSTQGDFQHLPFEDNSFDCAYQIEATCHSPDRVQCFKEIARVLKKGGLFNGYEWVMCNNYDKNNPEHVRIKEGIEVGNGLPTLVEPEVIKQNLEDAGFEIIDAHDEQRGVHSPHQIPWYDTLNGKMTLSGFRMTSAGRFCTHALVTILETLRIAPRGSIRVSALLNATANDLVDGGKLEIFTPSYFFLAKKK